LTEDDENSSSVLPFIELLDNHT